MTAPLPPLLPPNPGCDPDRLAALVSRWSGVEAHALTLALHRHTRWPIVLLADATQEPAGMPDTFGHVVLSGVVHPAGGVVTIRGRAFGDALRAIEAQYVPEAWAATWHDATAEQLRAYLPFRAATVDAIVRDAMLEPIPELVAPLVPELDTALAAERERRAVIARRARAARSL